MSIGLRRPYQCCNAKHDTVEERATGMKHGYNKGLPWFKFYPADFMHGVRGLGPREVGIYTMLLCKIYEEGGPIEYHARRLSTYCGVPLKTFEIVMETLVNLGKIQEVEGRLINARAEAEIASREADLKNASKAGKASAEKRQQKQQKQATDVEQPFNNKEEDTDKEYDGDDTREREVSQLPAGATDREHILKAIGVDPVSGLTGPRGRMLGTPSDMLIAARWLALPGMNIDHVCQAVCGVMRQKRDGVPSSFSYFDRAMQEFSGQLTLPPLEPIRSKLSSITPSMPSASEIMARKLAREALQ